MRALVYTEFGETPVVSDVRQPTLVADGVIVRVEASGVCRSDLHGWEGHDPSIELPHVPGHELAGVIDAVGAEVRRWRVGDRVTVPFVGGCGRCGQCRSGNHQVCDDQFQPGFTHWGSFAELVAIHHADINLVRLPEDMDMATAASLGCRFVTAFRAVVDQSGVRPGDWMTVHGCGGVGLSAIMIARALDVRVVAIDVASPALELAAAFGAEVLIDAHTSDDVVAEIHERTDGGAHVSIDALGIPETCGNSIRSLRKRGRHVQVGWMLGDHHAPPVPMDLVMGNELEIVGSHGMQAHRYGDLLAMIDQGQLEPGRLIQHRISLDEAADALVDFDGTSSGGISVITTFA